MISAWKVPGTGGSRGPLQWVKHGLGSEKGIVENSSREMGGKDGHQWEDDDDNSKRNGSLLMRTNMSGTMLSVDMLLATTLTWVLFLFPFYREENKLRAHRQ